MRTVHFVVPESIDDPGRPSGGNIYDREVARDLREFGWTVREHLVGRSLRDVLRALPRGATVAVDGLLGCADAAAVHEAAQRVRVVLLVHMPAGLEGGERADVAVETERAALCAAHAVIATSNWTRGLLIARHGATAERVRVAEPGVESAPL
ncbi:MAG TPA: glycosyltransferase, partial [Jatrophihabitantaceae bacterium]|nr:glycosyltransferase [Jatrophihabitantaceae bacterium]